jgi:hypothetical protein
MDNQKCNDKAPNLNQSKDLLKKLLVVELERLETAVKIENERKIVFPETSIIIRDIQKLNDAINGKKTESFDLGDL